NNVQGELQFEELAAFPLSREEIHSMLGGLAQLTRDGIDDLLFFYYARDWRAGGTLWTPKRESIPLLRPKYVSAARVISVSIEQLTEELLHQDICMTTLFIDRPADKLMAYQRGRRSNFFTAAKVNKASGLRQLAARLSLAPEEALGAGDTEMDT